jgi:hypothetical protein
MKFISKEKQNIKLVFSDKELKIIRNSILKTIGKRVSGTLSRSIRSNKRYLTPLPLFTPSPQIIL